MPGLTIFRFDAPIFFANARTFADQVLRLADADPKPHWILVAAEPISDIDTTAADMLEELAGDLETRGVQLAFAELKEPVQAKIDGYGMHPVSYTHLAGPAERPADRPDQGGKRHTKGPWTRLANVAGLESDGPSTTHSRGRADGGVATSRRQHDCLLYTSRCV